MVGWKKGTIITVKHEKMEKKVQLLLTNMKSTQIFYSQDIMEKFHSRKQ